MNVRRATIFETVSAYNGPGVPVVFNGAVPVLIGSVPEAPSAAAVRPAVEAMLISRGRSAEKIGVAIATPPGAPQDDPRGVRCVVCFK